jgi:truncated hemoglobin YjbI
MRHSHDGLPITPVLASRWLGHFRRALEATIVASSDRGAAAARRLTGWNKRHRRCREPQSGP